MKTTQWLSSVALMLMLMSGVQSRPSVVNSLASPEENKVEEEKEKSTVSQDSQDSLKTSSADEEHPPDGAVERGDLKTAESNRRNKMIDFLGSFLPHPFLAQYQNPFYQQPQQFYDPSADYEEEEDLMSRANRRKPSNRENSPIFYVRLPPTPYMYVPGMGYISQPPTIRPMAFAPPPMPQPVVNPFINVPVNFLSNGKPTNVYEWPSVHPQYPPYSRPPTMHSGTRPQHQSSYRPHKNSFLPDSKITHLKGPYVFNGRPEDIFVLPQQSAAPQPHPQQTHFGLNPYHHQQAYSGAQDYQTQQLIQHQQQQQQLQLQHQASQIPQHHDYSHHSQSHNSYNSHQQQQQQAFQQAHQLQQQFGGYNPGVYNGGYNSIYNDPLANYY